MERGARCHFDLLVEQIERCRSNRQDREGDGSVMLPAKCYRTKVSQATIQVAALSSLTSSTMPSVRRLFEKSERRSSSKSPLPFPLRFKRAGLPMGRCSLVCGCNDIMDSRRCRFPCVERCCGGPGKCMDGQTAHRHTVQVRAPQPRTSPPRLFVDNSSGQLRWKEAKPSVIWHDSAPQGMCNHVQSRGTLMLGYELHGREVTYHLKQAATVRLVRCCSWSYAYSHLKSLVRQYCSRQGSRAALMTL